MNVSLLIKRTVSTCLMAAVFSAYSMVGFAGDVKVAGSVMFDRFSDIVTVNGEVAPDGRTFFTSSSVSTPEKNGTTLNLGKAGMVELDPNTSVVVSFDANTVSIVLSEGSVTNIRSLQDISVTTPAESILLKAGESVSAQQTYPDRWVIKNGDPVCEDTNKNGIQECDPAKQPGGQGSRGLSAGALAAILLSAGGIVGIGILLGTKGSCDRNVMSCNT